MSFFLFFFNRDTLIQPSKVMKTYSQICLHYKVDFILTKYYISDLNVRLTLHLLEIFDSTIVSAQNPWILLLVLKNKKQ